MEKRNMLFIYNPRAGKAKIRSNLLDIIDIFARADFEVTACPTQKPGDGISAIREREMDRFDLVVCSGGDGTLDEVVTGMMQRGLQIPIGYVPAGSTNDFANSLGIPRNMMDAAQAVVGGRTFGCDIGAFNDDFFVYIAAFGIFTEVSYETPQDIKNVLGHMAYILEGMRRLSAIRAYPMRVQGDDIDVEGEFLFGMITNSTSVGGFKRITGKNVELDDGKFEVTLIKKPANPMELNMIMASLLNRNINTDCMYCFRTGDLRIVSEDQVAWTLDGEFGGKHKEVQICNKKHALRIRIPE